MPQAWSRGPLYFFRDLLTIDPGATLRQTTYLSSPRETRFLAVP